MKTLAIVSKGKAFLPERVAYEKYFRQKGLRVYCCDNIREARAADIVIIYFGLFLIWSFKRRNNRQIIIGEYHSLSSGKFGRIKDMLKRILNPRPDAYIFLNKEVRRGLFFSSRVRHVIRPMGWDAELVSAAAVVKKEYDFVYCGSLGTRASDVVPAVELLGKLGFTICLIGPTVEEWPSEPMSNITFLGRQTRESVYRNLKKARFGLNITPNRYPLNVQDSTKMIEYAAVGLPILTNRYYWSEWFVNYYAVSHLYYEDIVLESGKKKSIDLALLRSLVVFNDKGVDINERAWGNVIEQSGLPELISL